MELDWNKRSNKTGSCDIFIFCYKEEYSKQHSVNINAHSHYHDRIKEYYDMGLSVQEAIDFDWWFTKLKLEFYHKCKVSIDSKWDVPSVKKDYYDNGLSIDESVTAFFQGK
jgi:hypothetical protein